MRKRNPMARDLRVNPLYRPRKGKSLRDQEGRADRWSRAAKHKQPKGTPGSAHGPGDFMRARPANFAAQVQDSAVTETARPRNRSRNGWPFRRLQS